MSYTSRTIDADPESVWRIVVDPTTYPQWLIGAQAVVKVDPAWPRPGSKFFHRVGVGPFTVSDSTVVEEVEPGQRLRLAVRARPFISAIATFELVSDGTRTVVSIEEEPRWRLIGELVRPMLDPSTHVRNHRSLRRLEDVVCRSAGLAAAPH